MVSLSIKPAKYENINNLRFISRKKQLLHRSVRLPIKFTKTIDKSIHYGNPQKNVHPISINRFYYADIFYARCTMASKIW